MSKHTPGPWKINGVALPGRYQIDDAANKPVAVTDARYDLNTGYEQADANSRLIAAAPDMLEALKLAQTIIGHPDDEGSKLIAAAIAKAEVA